MELSDEMLVEISFVQTSRYRTNVMNSLIGEVKMPSQIAADANIHQNHISAILNQLKSHDLVEIINPEVRKGRLYRLTKKGEEVSEKLSEVQLV